MKKFIALLSLSLLLAVSGCAGGIDVNTKGQALNADREPVPGLYAAGEIIGMANAFGRTTIGGVGNTGTYIWGKMAGDGVQEYVQSLK